MSDRLKYNLILIGIIILACVGIMFSPIDPTVDFH
jgi:hypothetical protein